MEYALFSYFAVGARLLHPSDKQRQRPPGTEHLLWFWRKQAPPDVISGYQLPLFAKNKNSALEKRRDKRATLFFDSVFRTAPNRIIVPLHVIKNEIHYQANN